jgi:hypothetical protein
MNRSRLRQAARAAGAFSLAMYSPAFAAGGAEVVDDAFVETPGTCHLESWFTRNGPSSALVDLSPGCTPDAWPNLEIDGTIQHGWGGGTYTTIGPALKRSLKPLRPGLAMAVDAGATFDAASGRLEGAGLIVPLTVGTGQRYSGSVNIGYSYVRTSPQPHSAFLGAQIEVKASYDVTLMAETFGRVGDRAGAQVGVRWTPKNGPVDLDLIAGRFADGVTRNTVTFGVAVRR